MSDGPKITVYENNGLGVGRVVDLEAVRLRRQVEDMRAVLKKQNVAIERATQTLHDTADLLTRANVLLFESRSALSDDIENAALCQRITDLVGQ